MKTQKAELESVKDYIRDLEDANARYKARINYLEKELNNMRNLNRSPTPERLEPIRTHTSHGNSFESVHKLESLEKRLRDVEDNHQQEILEYKQCLKTMEYNIQTKKAENDHLVDQVRRLQHELETAQMKLRSYERAALERTPNLGIDIKETRERLEMLQSELDLTAKAYNTELKELKNQITRKDNELQRMEEALEMSKRKNKELVERIVQLEKDVELPKQKMRNKTPLPLERTMYKDRSRGASPWGASRIETRDSDASLDYDRLLPSGSVRDEKTIRHNHEDDLRSRLEFKALQQERDLYKAQKEALEKKLEKILQTPFPEESEVGQTYQKLTAEQEKKTVWSLRRELQEVRAQNTAYKRTVEDLEEELRTIEASGQIMGDARGESSSTLRRKVMELRRLLGDLEGQNKVLRASKVEAERKVIELQTELEEQTAKVSKEINSLVEYNTRLQDEMVTEKKKFVDYLQQMNKIHVERQEEQMGKKTHLEEEANRYRRLLFEKENEMKIANTKYESEIKKLQSEIEVAKEFGDSHLREIENLKWENEKLNEEMKRLNEGKKKLEEDLERRQRQLNDAISDMNRVQRILKRAKEEGMFIKEIDAVLNSRPDETRGNVGNMKAPQENDLNDSNSPISREEFITQWEGSTKKAQIRPQLLMKAIKQKDLADALIRDRSRLFNYLTEALMDENPEMYERAIQLMGSLIDDEKVSLSPENKLQPYSSQAAVKSLCPGKREEPEDVIASRHYGALVVLSFLIEYGFVWEISTVRLAEKYNTLNTLLKYMKNLHGKKLWQKRKSLSILKSLIDSLQQKDLPEVLITEGLDLFLENIDDSDPVINASSAEALRTLSRLPGAQKKLENPEKLTIITKRLIKGDNKEMETHLLICLLNLSNSRIVQEKIYSHSMIDFMVKAGLDDRYPENVQGIYRLFINMASSVDDKGLFYEKAFAMITKDTNNPNKATRKLALAFLAVIIKKSSNYEKDVIIFPSIVQNMDHDDLEIQLIAVQLIFVLCARFQHPLMNVFMQEKGIERCVSLYCTTSDPNVFNITGNLMLLLASAHTKYIDHLLTQGGYPMVRRLFKDLEHPESQAVYRAANILRLLSLQASFIQALGEPNEKIMATRTFLLKLLQSNKVDDELIIFGLAILRVMILPETVSLMRKHQIMEVLIGFLNRKVYIPQTMMDVIGCIQRLIVVGSKEGVIYDLIAEDRCKGLEVLGSIITPPTRQNALAQGSIEIWDTIGKSMQPKMIGPAYSAKITNILHKVMEDSDIPELKKVLTGVLQKLK